MVCNLGEMTSGQEGDFFALLAAKEELKTREGRPYWKVTFRDATRLVTFPVWENSPQAADCREHWTPGAFYKLRAVYRETSYGPQLEIRKIREVIEADADDGFDPRMCLPQSRFAPEAMFAEIQALATTVEPPPLRAAVEKILCEYREPLLHLPAARRNHHAYVGGWLEHTLSVSRTAAFLAEKYAVDYPDMRPPLCRGLVVAGAILHDIGKLREIDPRAEATAYTAEGELIGHMLLGRDIVREAAAAVGLDGELRLRLEHVVIAHQRLPEWGVLKPPMTPEALLVHYADDVDAKYHILVKILESDGNAGPMTGDKNLMRQKLYRGTSTAGS